MLLEPGEGMDSHENPVPGLGKIFKDLHRDVPGIDAVQEATVGEGWSQMGKKGHRDSRMIQRVTST